MRMVDLIIKKRQGDQLTTEEINGIVAEYTAATIPDYQMAAWAMAVLFQGMDDRETTDLTLAMARSGEELDLGDLQAVDKHSTGGVGDKTSLVLGPLLAAAGLPIAKMSGRGLGFTGGTLDKLEAIPGMRINLSRAEFMQALKQVGMVIAGQTADLAPADKKLYALRDVTGTVESIPLIAASIMSKKLAAGAQSIVLDVKVGSGAFMKELEQAQELAQRMVRIGERAGRNVAAVLSTMEQPLGYAVGNALEIVEVIQTLQGHGPDDLVELCLELGTQLVLLHGRDQTAKAARRRLQTVLSTGQALSVFRRFVEQQGGDSSIVDDPARLPAAPVVEPLAAWETGYLAQIDALEVGLVAMELGAGRATIEDTIDPAVGVVLATKTGEQIGVGETLLSVHAQTPQAAAQASQRLRQALVIQAQPVRTPPLILDVITR